jgi:hypothetical protein
MKRRLALVALLALPLSGCAVALGPNGPGRLPVALQVGSGCNAFGHDPLAEPMERYSVRRGFFQVLRGLQQYQSRSTAAFTPAATTGPVSVGSCPSQSFSPLRY